MLLEMTLYTVEQIRARLAHAAAEDDPLGVADAARGGKRLSQIVKDLLQRSGGKAIAALRRGKHILTGQVLDLAQA